MKYVLTTIVSLAGAVSPAAADVIVLGADPWCPYNCKPDSDSPGYMVEVAQEALAFFGHEVRYVTVAWARGIRQAELGDIHGVIGAIPEETPGFVFGPPIGTYEDTIVFRAGEAVPPEEIGNYSDLRIGAINGYEYFGPVSDYIEANKGDRSIVQYASGDDALTKNLRKLIAGRLDLVAEVRAVLDYNVAQLGISDEVEIVDTDDASEIFIAFSPALDVSATYAEQLNEGLIRLKESGRYAAILAKYGLTASES